MNFISASTHLVEVHEAVVVLVRVLGELLLLGGDPLRLQTVLLALLLMVHVPDVLRQRDLAVTVLRDNTVTVRSSRSASDSI